MSIGSLSYLNPKYVFETFVVGPNNQLAYATAISISKAPAKQYNPFFIYESLLPLVELRWAKVGPPYCAACLHTMCW